jgi:8-oxo-dGTP pyrophosphatase MutT (NUDIX family)
MRGLFGRFVYFAFGWLIFRLFVHESDRARILMLADNQILLCKSMIGDNCWEIPGGGAGKGENVLAAGIREVEEETSVKLNPNQIKELKQMEMNCKGSIYIGHYYLARLDKKPPIVNQWPWILDSRWFSIDKIPTRIKDNDKKIIQRFLLPKLN